MERGYNLKKVLIGICIFAMTSSFCIFARDVTELNLEKMDSWREKFDISSKNGKYNVIVTATDFGGNTTYGGPFNIFIDEKSDLPITRITNPVSGMNVSGNLNIVGSCIDDDAVQYVELILDGNIDEPVRASGKEFWQYFLSTEGMEEGLHTIEVYGVDVNGLKGKSSKTSWILDRQTPVTEITNIGSGSIVSGTVNLKGVISDGNGIASMAYSFDNGTTFTNVKVSNNKKTNTANFSISFDTKKMKDGPTVVWFKATDMQGSFGYYSFVCFIDNTKPFVEIAYPREKEIENGTFTAAGSARDAIGLKSLSWEFNGEKGDFEIIPGNNYWSKEFNATKNGKLVITAIDVAGNITKKERQININSELDKPIVQIQWPKQASQLKDGEFFIRGIAKDDDAVASVKIAVDGTVFEPIETRGVFNLVLQDEKFMTYGKHSVSVSAIDRYGVQGKETKIEYFSIGTKPKFSSPILRSRSDVGDATFGKIVSPESGSVFELAATSLSGIKEASYTIEWSADRFGISDERRREEKTIELKNPITRVPFSIPVETLPWGMVHLTFRVVDVANRVSNYATALYVQNLTKVIELPDNSLVSEINDERVNLKILEVADKSYSRAMNVLVPSNSKSTIARWNKDKNVNEKTVPIGMKLELTSAEKDIAISYKIFASMAQGAKPLIEGKSSVTRPDKNSGNGTAFIPLNNLPAGMVTVEITASGKNYSSKCYAQIGIIREIASDDINDERIAQWLSTEDTVYDNTISGFVLGSSAKLSGIANLGSDVTATFVGNFPGLEVSSQGKAVTITATRAGAYYGVVVRATDENGARVDFAPVTLIFDNQGTSFSIQRPALYEWVRNRLVISGTANSATGIDSVEYSLDNGENWKSFGTPRRRTSFALYAEETITNLEDGLITVDIRATDISGNISYSRTSVQKDTIAPSVEVIVPIAENTINGINVIAFLAKDEGNLERIEYVSNATGRRIPLENTSMPNTIVGTTEMPISSTMRFDFTDSAGNVTTINSWDFVVDSNSDLPIATIHLPIDNEVITKDFIISGTVIDDDGPSTVYYRIDNGRYTQIEGTGYNFNVEVPLSSLTDNEHSITVYSVDINGVRGPEYVRNFRVSLAEPEVVLESPRLESAHSKLSVISGTASDRNGIDKVQISLDNGVSWNDASGKGRWSYQYDSRAIPDGTHSIFVKATDNYGIEGFYASIINIDNTPPELSLEFPLDESKTTGLIFFSGYTIDNIGLTDLYITVTSLDGRTVNPNLARTELVPDRIITTSIDISGLPNGRYNIQVTGKDAADNIASISRNITLDNRVAEAEANIYYPLNGEYKTGEFNIYGEIQTKRKINSVTLVLDGRDFETVVLTSEHTSYFKFQMNGEKLSDGNHSYKVRANLEGGFSVESITQSIMYSSVGAWVTVDNFDYGEFAFDRPIIRGRAGYSISQDEIDAAKSKGATKAQKNIIATKAVSYIELSFDNGKTFKRISSNKNWKYRIENEDISEGYHFMLIRAVFKNGETAINRCVIQIDKTAPFVKIISPSIGGRYNQELEFSGLASDAIGLNSVSIALRKGDKTSYELPRFIQGLYFDSQYWGATLFSVGMGLSFFDDNVKLQAQWGQFTQVQRAIFSDTQIRYGGNVFGVKLLANIAHVPFRALFGRNFDWLSMGFALGANFSIFTETSSGKAQMLSAILGQLEFPRVTFKKSKLLRTIALYSEFQLWFIPSDVSSSTMDIKNVIFQFSEGLRINIF